MGKGRRSALSQHRLLIIGVVIWAIIWAGIIYALYRFPYMLDIFNLSAHSGSIADLSFIVLIVGLISVTFATLFDGYVRDRRRIKREDTPPPKVNEELFKPHS